jgi:hypothetical protein
MTEIAYELDLAEEKAWDALARYKFVMFGYWAGVWVHLNHVADKKRPNPFTSLVKASREHISRETYGEPLPTPAPRSWCRATLESELKMDVDELLEKKSELERRLGNILTSELSKFRNETGFYIESVYVEQLSVQTMGEKRPAYITGAVSCKIAF